MAAKSKKPKKSSYNMHNSSDVQNIKDIRRALAKIDKFIYDMY